jgi:anti-sigma-K factor RskA
MKHDEAYELLAALSLDAVDEHERRLIDEHVATCPKCRSELDSLLEVAGALGNSVDPLPEGLWTSISTRIYDNDDATHPMPVLVYDSGERVTSSRRRHLGRPAPRTVFSSFAAVAAALIVVLAVNLANQANRASNLQHQLVNDDAANAALVTPGHTVVDLASTTQADLAEFVLVPDGRGYLINSKLPTLPAGDTYQLWGVINGKPISIALMGTSPRKVTFTVSGSKPTLLGITVEPTGGSPTPTSAMVASGAVED